MTKQENTRISKFLSFVLRHSPESAGLKLEEGGWVEVAELLAGCHRAGRTLSPEKLEHVVMTNAKKRFEFNEDASRIRASQGHSVAIDLQYESQVPPPVLYHGTATRFLDSISESGLQKMSRHHVHLSAETKMTMQVGSRHGKPVLLTIRAAEMHEAGHEFFLSTNDVWLVEHVPTEFIEFPETG